MNWFLKQVLGGLAGWIGGLLKDWLAARKLQKQTARADRAEDAVRQQAQVISNAEVRNEAEQEVQKQDASTNVGVADNVAVPAAERMRDDEFARD